MGLRHIIATNHLSLDLHPFGTDKGTIHSYIDHLYVPIFESGEEFRVIYEIGVMRGASLAAWKLLNPSAKVVGLDIEYRELHPVAETLRQQNDIQILYKDAYKESVLAEIQDEIDLLIDDGPHTIQSQIEALKWVDKLSAHGTLVIEDIAGGIVGVNRILKHVSEEMRPHCIYFSMFHRTGRFDDTVMVLSKSNRVVQSLSDSIEEFKFWGMSNYLSWKIFRIVYKFLALMNLKHYR